MRISTMRLKGKKALITGAGRGIGKAIALAFAKEGANLALTARSMDSLKQVYEETKALDVKVYPMDWEMLDVPGIEKKLEGVKNALNGLDIVVNNAGVTSLIKDDPNRSPTAEENFDFVMDINLKALFFMCQGAAKILKESGGGVIINLSSDAGLRGATEQYGISKWGVTGFTQGFARQVAPDGIRVNAIAPGPVATRLMNCEDGIPKESEEYPLGRFSLPEEVADVAVFLASDESRAIFGNSIVINSATNP